MLPFLPPKSYRYTLRKGYVGSDVYALQLNLNLLGQSLTEDGDFGPLTEKGVIAYQSHHSLTADGVAGEKTQTQMCLDCIAKYPQHLPTGLLRGIVEGESGYFVGCVNTDAPGGIDTGWTQDRIEIAEYSDARFRKGFRAADAFPAVANQIDTAAKSYYGRPGALSAKNAWWCATLNWNWPAAAEQYANGDSATWVYRARWYPNLSISDDGRIVKTYNDGSQDREYHMTTRAQWVAKLGVPNVVTGSQWATFYVNSKWKYVGATWPTP